MASKEQLEELVTCPVCFEIFNNPYQLSCMHTMCWTCIMSVKHGNFIRCPECRRKTNANCIQKDFKQQQLIDLWNASSLKSLMRREKSVSDKLCDVCDENMVLCVCKECEQHLCEPCSKAHRRLKASKDHTVFSMDEVRAMKLSIEERKETIQHDINKFQQKVDEIAINVQSVTSYKEKQLNVLDKYIGEVIDKVEMHRNKMKGLISSYYAESMNELTRVKEEYVAYQRQLRTQVKKLTDVISSDNITSMIQSCQDLTKDAQKVLSEEFTTVMLAVRVNRGREIDDSSLPKVEKLSKIPEGVSVIGTAAETQPHMDEMSQKQSEEMMNFFTVSFPNMIQNMARFGKAVAEADNSDDMKKQFEKGFQDIVGWIGENAEILQRGDKNVGSLMPVMQTMLYPIIKGVANKFPIWLEENKDRKSGRDLERHQKQYQYMKQICMEFESQNQTDSETVQRERLGRIQGHLEVIRFLGDLPKELESDMSQCFETIPGVSQIQEQCKVM